MSAVNGRMQQRVLIVEDDEAMRSVIRQTLELHAIPTDIATTGAEALTITSREKFALMTIDYSLPDMTGDELVLALKEKGLEIPFIMITGRGDEDVAVSTMKLGARDYLVKTDDLVNRVPTIVREILDKIKTEEDLQGVRRALEESEERFRKIFQNSNEGILLLGDDLTILDINEKGLHFLGYEDRAELIGSPVNRILPPDGSPAFQDLLAPDKERRSAYRFEADLCANNGDRLLADIVVSTFQTGSGLHTLLNFRDISERIKHLELMKKAAEEWRVTFDAISDPVSVHDRDMRVVKANRAFMEFVGKPFAEIIGRKCHELIHPDSFPYERCPHLKTVSDGEIITEEIVHPDNDMHLLVTTSPVLSERGEVTGSVHIVKDITDLKNVRHELKDREHFLADILNGIEAGITVLDKEFRIVRANRFMEEKYAARMPLAGKHCYDVFQNRTETCVDCPTERTFASGEPSSEVIAFKTPGRKVCGWMEVFTFPHLDTETGEIIGVIEYMRDITERRRMEKALQESEEKFRLLFENAIDAILICHPETGIIVECNREAQQLSGLDKNELIGTQLAALEPPCEEARPHVQTLMGQAELAEGDTFSATICRKDGNLRDVSIRASRIPYQGGDFLQLVLRDITETKKMGERVKQAQKLESIGTLAAGIAHDFNNILTAILGFSEIIKTDLSTGTTPEIDDVDGIVEASHRASELVRQVLSFSRQSEMERSNINVSPIVKETVKFLKASLPSTILIEENVRVVPSKVYADPVHIHQVLMNLCTNAHHAMRTRGGTLTVALDEVHLTEAEGRGAVGLSEGDYVRLTVGDTGHGMDKLTISRIFDPFFSTKSREEGTGLGLSVVHGIVQSHGGAIEVESELGKGTTFRIYLPVSKQCENCEEDAEKLTELPGGSERILLVDDEEAIVKTAQRMLTRLGYEVTGCTDSEQCLEMFRNAPDQFDLVLTDLTMPRVTGLDLAREISLVSPGTPVILMTGFADALHDENLADHGITFMVKKPVLKKDLSQAIRSALDRVKSTG